MSTHQYIKFNMNHKDKVIQNALTQVYLRFGHITITDKVYTVQNAIPDAVQNGIPDAVQNAIPDAVQNGIPDAVQC